MQFKQDRKYYGEYTINQAAYVVVKYLQKPEYFTNSTGIVYTKI